MDSFRDERKNIIYHRSPRRVAIDNNLDDIDNSKEDIANYIECYEHSNRLGAKLLKLRLIAMFAILIGVFVSIVLIHASEPLACIFVLVLLSNLAYFIIIYKLYNAYQNKHIVKKVFNQYLKKKTKKNIEETKKSILANIKNDINKISEKYPSIDECITYNENNKKLWSRYFRFDDYLTFSIGKGLLKDLIKLKEISYISDLYINDLSRDIKNLPQDIIKKINVPICIDIEKHKVIGICEKSLDKGILYSIIGQMVINNCYTEMKMAFAYNGKTNKISMFRNLPHVWSDDFNIRFMADNINSSEELFVKIMKQIDEMCSEYEEKAYVTKQYFILFITDSKNINCDVLDELIEFSYNKPLSIIFWSNRFEKLPHYCDVIIEKGSRSDIVSYQINNESIKVKLDYLSESKITEIVARLSRIRVKDDLVEDGFKDGISLFELLNIKGINELDIDKNYRTNKAYIDMKLPIGICKNNKILKLNFSEKGIGPHGLIAGTTGSGKTELIQTIILSMAIRYSPNEINFLLIDFKGGQMAHHFEKLPHVCGILTNLDIDYINRAMLAIKCEVLRRQKIFLKYGVDCIDEYMMLSKKCHYEVIPKIIIIVDEFAELKREHEEFIDEIISIAQKGRSLGIHLLLATQKPTGNIDNNILCNSRFRICLKVQSEQDSEEVIGKKDAASISNVGRGYISVDNGQVFEEFQTAWSGKKVAINDTYNRVCKVELDGTRIYPIIAENNDKCLTEYECIVSKIIDIWENYECKINKIWLPILKDEMLLDDIRSIKTKNNITNGYICEVGMYDDVVNCNQGILSVDFVKYGSLLICGNIGSGKTMTVNTILTDISDRYDRQFMEVDIIDFSNRTLSKFENIDVVTNYVDEEYGNRIKDIFWEIEEMFEERKHCLQGIEYKDYISSSKNIKCPLYLLVIHNYIDFRVYTNGRFEDLISKILREGGKYGIFMIISSVKVGGEGLQNRFHENIRQILCLNMSEKAQYLHILKLSEIDIMPKRKMGRGLMVRDGLILEVQIARIK